MTTSVDFHFDPMCPFAYQTSLWIRDVRNQTGLEVTWRFFSLEEVNRVEGKKHPLEREWSYGWSTYDGCDPASNNGNGPWCVVEGDDCGTAFPWWSVGSGNWEAIRSPP